MIPQVVHFIFGLQEQTHDFSLAHYLAVYSASKVLKPEKIIFSYIFEPTGYYWSLTKNLVELRKYQNIRRKWGNKEILKYEHLADSLRLEILYEEGGIYLDIDTISVRPIDDLLSYSGVLGTEKSMIAEKTGICNAVMMFTPRHPFLKRWLELCPDVFESYGWNEASSKLPLKIFEEEFKHDETFMLTNSEFFFSPSWDETEKIFTGNIPIPSTLRILHLWEVMSRNRMNELTEDELRGSASLYAKIVSLHSLIIEDPELYKKKYRDGRYGRSKTRRYYSGELTEPRNHEPLFKYLRTLFSGTSQEKKFSLVDLGCGDAKLGASIVERLDVSYIGVDPVDEVLRENSLFIPI